MSLTGYLACRFGEGMFIGRRVCCGMPGLLCPGEARDSVPPRVALRFPVCAAVRCRRAGAASPVWANGLRGES